LKAAAARQSTFSSITFALSFNPEQLGYSRSTEAAKFATMANTAAKPKTEPRTLVAFVARMVQVCNFFRCLCRGLRADA
jgi:hypothetical protein